MAYYCVGWEVELRPLFERNPDSGNFWKTVNGNCLDMCVLDWCKLFGGRNENYSWKRVVEDPDAFKSALLEHLGLDDAAFGGQLRTFREYRDKWVAHLDSERIGLYPTLDTAKEAVWFYYEWLGREQVDQEIGSKTIEAGYKECEEEARMVYAQVLKIIRTGVQL
jgi:hypothetical protein